MNYPSTIRKNAGNRRWSILMYSESLILCDENKENICEHKGIRAAILCVGCANGEDEITKDTYILITVALKGHFILVGIVEEEVNCATQSANIDGNQIEVDTIYSISRE